MSNVKKYISEGYTCTGIGDNVVYAVDPAALYAEVHSVILSNTDSTDKTSTVLWKDYSTQYVTTSTFWGDGNTPNDWAYDYISYSIITNASVPNGASLHVLNSPLFLSPKDFITVSASVTDSITVTVIVTECFSEEQDSNSYSLNLETVNSQISDKTYGA